MTERELKNLLRKKGLSKQLLVKVRMKFGNIQTEER